MTKEKDQTQSDELDEVTQTHENDVVDGEVINISNEDEALEELGIYPSLEEVELLRQELLEAQTRAEENLDGWQRALAEFANYKKRVERDQQQIYQNLSGSILKRYLEVVDDLERSLKNKPREVGDTNWIEGIELIYQKLLNILDSEGVKQMNADGELFDPNLHEAVSSEESDQHESGQIIESLQTGYMLGDRVLRPAKVRVAK